MKYPAFERANAAGGNWLGHHRGQGDSEGAVDAAKDQMLKQRVSETHRNSCCWFPHALSSAILERSRKGPEMSSLVHQLASNPP